MTARQLHRVVSLWPSHGSSQSEALAWTQDAPCRRDPDLWFSEDPADVEAAKAACLAECPLRRVIACMDYAFDNDIVWGVWGGVSREERVEKRCYACGETKPLAEFWASSSEADGRRADCRSCSAAMNRDLRRRRSAGRVDGRIVNLAAVQDMRSAEAEERLRRYAELMSEPGMTRDEAARTLGITDRTALRYEAKLRARSEVAA